MPISACNCKCRFFAITCKHSCCFDSPSPTNAAAALDAPSPANANAGAWDSGAVAADVSPSPGDAAALDAQLLANADAVLSIAAGLHLSSSSANAAAWDSLSEAGVDLKEVQNCQALGGCEVSGSTRWTKVRHHRVLHCECTRCSSTFSS